MMRTNTWAAKFLGFSLFCTIAGPCRAQQAFSGTDSLEQSLRKLNELGTVLMIAAHPDDERTAVLAYFARGRHMRTAYLSLTRGEGGQNLIGPEQGAQLGLIRTQELLDARRIDGAEQFFTRAIDFGFSKTAAETLEKWGHERILGDVVWVMRRYRPDVVVLVFTGTPMDGHGQHQASVVLAKEAFAAAGDPQRYADQLKYAEPWQPQRLVHAVFNFGGGAMQDPAAKLPPAGTADTGAFNPILGYSYEELAVLSRSMHHSQGTGAMRRPGAAVTEFTLVAGAPQAGAKDLFDGIDTTWNRLPGGAAVKAILDDAIARFEPAHPERMIPLLLKARPLIAAMHDPLAGIKLGELDEAIGQCAGLWVDAQPRQPEVTPGSHLPVTVTVLNRSAAPVTLESVALEGMWWKTMAVTPPEKLGNNQSHIAEFAVEVPALQPFSQPYWLAKPAAGDDYTVDDRTLIGLPDTPAVLRVRARISIEGTRLDLVRPVQFRYAERSEGERVRPLVVVPAVAVNLPDTVALFPSAEPRKVSVVVKAGTAHAAGTLRLEAPAGWKVEPGSAPFEIAAEGEQREIAFHATPSAGDGAASLRAIATVDAREISNGMQTIVYPHIPTQALFPPAKVKAVRANVKVTVRRVGYIMGAGDEMPGALRQLGLEVTLLTPSDLGQGDLARFETIVAGVRAYDVRPDLRANQARLMEYVRNGGTYVVQYQSGMGGLPPGFPGAGPVPADMHFGPYPFSIPAGNGSRVTVEEAPVAFPHPGSPLLQTPNRITGKDFEGWIQERGLNFPNHWDERYETVLSSHDPGEPPLEGGELWTHYGKGVYIFTAYSWFRQLPAGVPGAYRLFANLLSAK